jgi:Flp pilus assembly pilin Flp
MCRKRGQSILEYIIVLTAIVAVIIVAAGTIIKPAIEKGFNDTASSIKDSTGKLPGVTATPVTSPAG